MRKILLFTLLTAGSFVAKAQQAENAYHNGDNILNLGVGLGNPFFGAGYSSSLPVNPTLSFEHGVTDEISAGGIISYANSKFSYVGYGASYTLKLNAIYIGARGSYHFNELLDLDKRFDVYGGASLGYVIVSASDNEGSTATAGSGIGLGVFAGGKYYFQPKVGVFTELGYQSLSVASIGITFKI